MDKLYPTPKRVLVYGKPTDMRKFFDGLFCLVKRQFQQEPTNGDLFLFINKRKNYAKGLLWDRTGFLLIAKKLEKGRFTLRCSEEIVSVELSQLRKFFDGLPVGGKSYQKI